MANRLTHSWTAVLVAGRALPEDLLASRRFEPRRLCVGRGYLESGADYPARNGGDGRRAIPDQGRIELCFRGRRRSRCRERDQSRNRDRLDAGTPGRKLSFRCGAGCPAVSVCVVTIEEETGKIDLNTASPVDARALLYRADPRPVAGHPDRRTHRRVPHIRRRSATAKRGPRMLRPTARFTTVMQLDQIEGISPRIFRSAVRLVTVRSGPPRTRYGSSLTGLAPVAQSRAKAGIASARTADRRQCHDPGRRQIVRMAAATSGKR